MKTGDEYRMHIDIRLEKVTDGAFTGDRFTVTEEIQFEGIDSFGQVANILHEFHVLGQSLKGEM